MNTDEIRAALAAATPGPWRTHDFGHPGDQEPSSIVVHTGKFDWNDVQDPDGTSAIAWMPAWDRQDSDNAHLIANAPTWLAELLAEVDSTRRELGDVHVSLYSEIAMLTARAKAAEQAVERVRDLAAALHREGREMAGLGGPLRQGMGDSAVDAAARILRALDGGES